MSFGQIKQSKLFLFALSALSLSLIQVENSHAMAAGALGALKGRSLGLAKEGRFQEAIWQAYSSEIPSEKVDGVKTQLREILQRNTGVKLTFPKMDGVTEKVILEFKEGVSAIFKLDGGTKLVSHTEITRDQSKLGQYAADANSEVAASILDEVLHLNVVPTTVIKEIDLPGVGKVRGSLQVMVKGATPGVDLYMEPSYLEHGSVVNMMILDYLAGNADRHSGNWLYLSDLNQAVAIDHGLSFRRGEGGCSFYNQIYAYFGNLFPPCDDILAASKDRVKQRLHMTESQNPTEEQIQAETAEWLEEKMFKVDFSKLSEETRHAISTLSVERLDRELSPYVQRHYLDRILRRAEELKRVLLLASA